MRKLMNDLTATLLAMHIKRVKRATYYASPKATVHVTAVGKWQKRKSRLDFHVSLGSPNYAERQMIKKLKKAGEPFPVKKVQFKYRKHAK